MTPRMCLQIVLAEAMTLYDCWTVRHCDTKDCDPTRNRVRRESTVTAFKPLHRLLPIPTARCLTYATAVVPQHAGWIEL